jgi:hypothetical protein
MKHRVVKARSILRTDWPTHTFETDADDHSNRVVEHSADGVGVLHERLSFGATKK